MKMIKYDCYWWWDNHFIIWLCIQKIIPIFLSNNLTQTLPFKTPSKQTQLQLNLTPSTTFSLKHPLLYLHPQHHMSAPNRFTNHPNSTPRQLPHQPPPSLFQLGQWKGINLFSLQIHHPSSSQSIANSKLPKIMLL